MDPGEDLLTSGQLFRLWIQPPTKWVEEALSMIPGEKLTETKQNKGIKESTNCILPPQWEKRLAASKLVFHGS